MHVPRSTQSSPLTACAILNNSSARFTYSTIVCKRKKREEQLRLMQLQRGGPRGRCAQRQTNGETNFIARTLPSAWRGGSRQFCSPGNELRRRKIFLTTIQVQKIATELAPRASTVHN